MNEFPQQVTAEGMLVTCSHCGGELFHTSSALLNTPGLTFFGLEWANRSAEVHACASCGHLEWFLRPAKPA